jgi:hypothetical protein
MGNQWFKNNKKNNETYTQIYDNIKKSFLINSSDVIIFIDDSKHNYYQEDRSYHDNTIVLDNVVLNEYLYALEIIGQYINICNSENYVSMYTFNDKISDIFIKQKNVKMKNILKEYNEKIVSSIANASIRNTSVDVNHDLIFNLTSEILNNQKIQIVFILISHDIPIQKYASYIQKGRSNKPAIFICIGIGDDKFTQIKNYINGKHDVFHFIKIGDIVKRPVISTTIRNETFRQIFMNIIRQYKYRL